ncbi:hypothetical protein VOLCADRAFT_104575 [Volvox carteri f. nagariensis]|uniref:Uncharacterized protein n=1 Tax=Volvox carteri f. nagariensis TaxID=3068 RepID=D8TUJ0_VOLCA|nr:uncharacterized protein VOLCADRAFT_104575 [Volvox carteri f. nagariensis]EFJ48831.1 hypothetical protein VOLCADRAFT_104575 [Volvox carteri f. nagariensis]|eukprot:XP_002950163.1 hypothetical protein VOLCADRAFT_104575 [Volvox carteri f. nagariensis]
MGRISPPLASPVSRRTRGGSGRAARPLEQVLLSWTPGAPSNLTLRPSSQPDGSALLGWWMGFNNANITESSSGTTFTQVPHTASIPPTPATTTSSFATLDHVKHLAITAPIKVVPGIRKLVYSTQISAKVTVPSTVPYNVVNAQDDMRLGACAMNFIDFGTMLVSDFIITNKGIWSLYERLPFIRNASYEYGAFTYARKIAGRTSPSQVHDLQIKYDPSKNVYEWWVDGKMKHSVGRLGTRPSGMRALLDLGGADEVIMPTSFQLGPARTLSCPSPGFGCFTLLDGTDLNAPPSSPLATSGLLNLNPTAPTTSREVYVLPRSWQADPRRNASVTDDLSLRLFGQGTAVTVSAFKVSYEL